MTSNTQPIVLCGLNNCRLLSGHKGQHNSYPVVWQFMDRKDRFKLGKAGFATPRGGAKGAYQNHVVRSNRVIVPYEKLRIAPITEYLDGYVIRLLPEQYFESAGVPKSDFLRSDCLIKVGENAFILYRTHAMFQRFPPLDNWQVCHLEKDGQTVKERGRDVVDIGQYVLRIPALGALKKRFEGVVQGVFAPEYADQETNYLCKCVLAWLIIYTVGSPYTTTQAKHLQAILDKEKLLESSSYEYKGMMRHGLTICPLCLRFIHYEELHNTVLFNEAVGNENAPEQIEGATRSTIVNLFHLMPLRYDSVSHAPSNVAWGHAVCNTRLGQRSCLSLAELIAMDRKVGIIKPEGIETFGWISNDDQMIRSPRGAVWIQLNGDMTGHEDVPPEPENEEVSLELEVEEISQIPENEEVSLDLEEST